MPKGKPRPQKAVDSTPKKPQKAHVGWKGPSMVRYLNEARWESNKIRRVMRHVRNYPNDLQAREWLSTFGDRNAKSFLASIPIKKKRVA